VVVLHFLRRHIHGLLGEGWENRGEQNEDECCEVCFM